MRGALVCAAAVAVVVVAALAGGVPQAHATPPAIPCGYECKWPAGSYSLPERVEAGGEFVVSWSYTWDPQHAMAAAAGGEGAPDGYYAVPGHADTPPPGYAGSAVTLRLPEELEVVGWEEAGFARERLWTDHYDRTVYEYTGINKYSESGRHDRSITVRLEKDGMFYPVTELVVDLGLSVANSPPGALFAVRGAVGAALSAEPPGASGASGAANEYPHRQSLKWPKPAVEAAAMPAGMAGAASDMAGDGETYVYGYLQYNDRTGIATAAPHVRACAYERGDGGTLEPLPATGGVCARTGEDGFYGMAVPRDPDGDGTEADIVVRFTLEGEIATLTRADFTTREDVTFMYDYDVEEGGRLAATLEAGRVTVPDAVPFRSALRAHGAIVSAHGFFADTFGHDVPHVRVEDSAFAGRYAFQQREIQVDLVFGRSPLVLEYVAAHEYGHHVMFTPAGVFDISRCELHYPGLQTSPSCAWSEGWADFVAAMVQGSPVIEYTDRYSTDYDFSRPTLDGDPVFPDRLGAGESVEGRVTGILWDIHDGDGIPEPHDDISGGTQLLWDVLLDEPEPHEAASAMSISDFRDDWNDEGYPSLDGVFRQNGIHAGDASLEHATMVVLDASGAAKSGDSAARAKAGETVRVQVATGAAAAPSIQFYGGVAAVMRPGGAAGVWVGDHAVTGSSREGLVPFVITVGGSTIATLHDVDAPSRVSVDNTPLSAPSAAFTAADTIVLEFAEPMTVPDRAAFVANPPGGASAPSVEAAVRDGSTVVLTLSPPAGAAGTWSVAVPGSVTDLAGNAYGGGMATAEFSADSELPTFTAARVGERHIEVTFGEDVREARAIVPRFTLTEPESGMEVRLSYQSSRLEDRRTLLLLFGQDVFAGTLTFHAPMSGKPYVEDLLGNSLADGTAALVAAAIVPTFSASVPREAGEAARHVTAEFRVPVSGTTRISEWRVNGEQPAGFGTIRPTDMLSLEDEEAVHLLLDEGSACSGGEVRIEYVRPTGEGAGSLAGASGEALASRSASTGCGPLVQLGARFVDARTVSLELDRAPPKARLFDERHDLGPVEGNRGGVDNFAVDGLGSIVGHVEPGSSTVTLHMREAAAANTEYEITNRALRYGPGTIPDETWTIHAVATHMDQTAPTVTRADVREDHVVLRVSEPLDAATLAGKSFTSPTLGEMRPRYRAGDLEVILVPAGDIAGAPHDVTVPAGITDTSGLALAQQSVTATGAPRFAISAPAFSADGALTLSVSPPMSEDTLLSINVRPGLGVVTASQSGGTVEVTTEVRPRHNTEYTVSVPVFEDREGRILEGAGREATVTYLDTVSPVATGARLVSPREIEILLSEPLDPRTVAGAAFSASPPLGALAPEYDAGSQRVVLRTSLEARGGTEYDVTVPGTVTDHAGLAVSPGTLRATLSGGAFLLGASFAGPSSVVLEASGPLDASTLSGILVAGLGGAAASYDAAAREITVTTAVPASEGIPYRVVVPGTVLDASGAAVGPTVLRATYEADRSAGAAPVALSASSSARGHVAVLMDRDVEPAGGSPGALDASLWAVGPIGGEARASTLAVAVGNTVWLEHAAAAAGAALEVTYTPGGADGDVADAATRRGLLGPARLAVEDRIPPTFMAATASPTATVVTFDRAVSGSTGSAEWTVAGRAVAGVSALGAAGQVPAAGSVAAALPEGTTRLALHHPRLAPGASPEVAYSPANPAVAGIGAAGARVEAGSVEAADGVAPRVVVAAFTGPRTLHVELDERPGPAAASMGAFTVTGPGGVGVGVDSVASATHSATVTLTLAGNARTGAHTVTAGGAVADVAGNAVAGGAKSAVASWAAAPGGAPTLSARTSSLTSTVVTFMPAVSGSTSAASWTVSGAPATGIARVGGSAMTDPGAASVTLPAGTESLVLSHAPLHGTAAEPIVRHSGTGVRAGGAELGDRAVKAADGVGPRLVSAVTVDRNETHVRLTEPAMLVEGSGAERTGHWEAAERPPWTVMRTVGDEASLTLGHGSFEGSGAVSYDGAPGEAGAVVDTSGNGLAQFEVRSADGFVPAFTAAARQFDVAAHTGECVEFVPGARPVFVIAASDGDRVGARGNGSNCDVTSILVGAPLVRGQEYTVRPPPYADQAGNMHDGSPATFTPGSDSAPPTVESARFSGPNEIRVEFSEPLRAVPAGAAFSVTPTSGTAIPLAPGGVSHAAGLRTVTLSLSGAASQGAHGVRVPATVADLVGNTYATPSVPVPATYDAMAPTAVSAAFTGERAVSLTVSEALDEESVNLIHIPSLGATSVSYAAGSTTVTLHTQLPAAAGSSHAVVVPAGVTDVAGVPLAPTTLWAARSDTTAPVAIGARTVSPTETEVDFGEAVRLGDSPTEQEHAAHWAVTEGTAARAVTDAEVVRGGLSVRLTHEAVGASAMPAVSYVAGAAHDDASVRDWATTPNYLASTAMAVAAGDGLPPRIDSLVMSVERPGEADAPARVWARAGDTVRFAMSMSEAAGTNAPTIRLAGAPFGMSPSGEGRLAWTYAHTVPPMGAAQGALAFVVSAADGGGNLAHAEVPTSGVTAMVDTILPKFTARTLGAGMVEVTLSEPVSGAISASEWTVGGAAASGVSARAGAAPAPTASLEAGTRFVLWHSGGGTGATPVVVYSPPARA